MVFINSWDNQQRANSYAGLEFPNTYYLAYRDLPEIISRHVTGRKAIDFGCGTGRSTRFLKKLGFSVTGIDISDDMLSLARQSDPEGAYQLVENSMYSQLGNGIYDFIQAIFTFDNIPGWDNRCSILRSLKELMNRDGRLLLLDSTPELYTHEWASFSTVDFPENRHARTGDIVRNIMLDVTDRRPVEDIFWTTEDYYLMFDLAGLKVEALYKPLGKESEPFVWKSETSVAPWMIYILKA